MIVVEQPGMMTTVQDLGRSGYQSQGVPAGGAVDAVSMRVGNLLVGNEESAAGLECTLRGPTLRFEGHRVVCVTGATVAGIRGGVPFVVEAGETLRLEKFESGCRAYVAVAGGIDVPTVMGSRSTYVRAGIGGHEGRALRAGDRLALGTPGREVAPGGWGTIENRRPEGAARVRVVAGPQRKWFGASGLRGLLSGTYRVSSQSDRMGVRLEGSAVKLPKVRELTSEAVALGTVQVPPDGQPIVLLADRQTIGGYSKIANVISADIGVVGQLRPGETLAFEEVDLATSDVLLARLERDLAMLRCAMRERLR